MKKNQMKKRVLASLWAVTLLVVSAVTAYADIAPEPDPNATQPLNTMMTVLIVAVVIIAVAVGVWRIIRSRKNK